MVLTSLFDDTVGAGLDEAGEVQNDTDGGGRPLRSTADDSSGKFQIKLHFGPRIQAQPEAMAAARKAADFWEQQLQDPIDVVIDVELADFPNSDLLNGLFLNRNVQHFNTQVLSGSLGYDAVRNALVNDAQPHELIVQQLPTAAELNVTLPQDITVGLSQSVNLTRANAKALRLGIGQFPVVGSAYDPIDDGGDNDTQVDEIDGTIMVNSNLQLWDFDRTDGLKLYREDFQTRFMGEIGEILGFTSVVDTVGFFINNPPTTDIELEMTPLDMFRFEPGQAANDFTGASRLLDPRQGEHVFYAGGNLDFREWPYAEIVRGEIPLSTGFRRGDELNDARTANRWRDDVFFRNGRALAFETIGIMEPCFSAHDEIIRTDDPFQSTAGMIFDITEADRTAFDAIGYDVVGPTPGAWNGIELQELTYTGNIGFVNESGDNNFSRNETASTAELLGTLAANRNAGDDKIRLGFEVHAQIDTPSDVDVYSFFGTAGTDVWIVHQ